MQIRTTDEMPSKARQGHELPKLQNLKLHNLNGT